MRYNIVTNKKGEYTMLYIGCHISSSKGYTNMAKEAVGRSYFKVVPIKQICRYNRKLNHAYCSVKEKKVSPKLQVYRRGQKLSLLLMHIKGKRFFF